MLSFFGVRATSRSSVAIDGVATVNGEGNDGAGVMSDSTQQDDALPAPPTLVADASSSISSPSSPNEPDTFFNAVQTPLQPPDNQPAPFSIPISPAQPPLFSETTTPIKQGRRISIQSFNIFSFRLSSKTSVDNGTTSGQRHASNHKRKSSATLIAPSYSPAAAAKSKRRFSRKAKTTQDDHITPVALSIQGLLSGNAFASSKPNASLNASALAITFLNKLQSEMSEEHSANKVISDLRGLSPSSTTPVPSSLNSDDAPSNGSVPLLKPVHPPVHGVCLPHNDEEADLRIFSQQTPNTISPSELETESLQATGSVASANLQSLIESLKDVHLVNAFARQRASPAFRNKISLHPPTPTPDQAPSDSPPSQPSDPTFRTQIQPPSSIDFSRAGADVTLLGALPSPSTIVDGVNGLASQLIALGLGNPEALLGPPNIPLDGLIPDHTGVYPPTDRMSCITYWWGYELVLPEPSMQYLARAKSISKTLMNFLTLFALLNGGVREIIPFIRYVAQFVDWEWVLIKSKDEGKGVVCAATWVMPVALVPRAWDFPPPPPPKSDSISESAPPITPPHPYALANDDVKKDPADDVGRGKSADDLSKLGGTSA